MVDRKYDHTHTGRIAHAMECTKIANNRFGYQLALELVLIGHMGIGGAYAERMIEAARDRDFDKFLEMLNEAGI